MNFIVKILYIALVANLFVPITAGLQAWMDFHWVIAGLLGLIVAVLPFGGSIIAVVCAKEAWGLSPFLGLIYYMLPYLVIAALHLYLSQKDEKKGN